MVGAHGRGFLYGRWKIKSATKSDDIAALFHIFLCEKQLSVHKSYITSVPVTTPMTSKTDRNEITDFSVFVK